MADKICCDLTESQKEAIENLRQRVTEELNEFSEYNKSFVLYRFLKARDWDVNKANLMLRKCSQWRKQNNIQVFSKEYQAPEILQKYFDKLQFCTDKEGCSVFYAALGKVDVKGLIKSVNLFEVDKLLIQLFELHEICLDKKSEKINRWLSGFVVILNISGLTLANATNMKGINTALRILRTIQDNSPERLKAVYFINAPSIFSFAFKLAKSVLSLETQKKFHYFATEGWQEELLKVIDADELPAFMGGTRTDPDGNPLCTTFLNQMGIVDESYYMDKIANPLENAPGIMNISVARSSSKKIPLQITEAGCVIEWEFETKTGDIGFGLFYKETTDEEGQVRQAVSFSKVDTNVVETGIYKCEKPGDYFVVFDNSYSWFRSKELLYRLKVLHPTELENQFEE